MLAAPAEPPESLGPEASMSWGDESSSCSLASTTFLRSKGTEEHFILAACFPRVYVRVVIDFQILLFESAALRA